MKLKNSFFIFIIFAFYSCSSLKSKKTNDVVKTDDVIVVEAVESVEETKPQEVITQNVAGPMLMLNEQQQLGKDLYENKCGNCHGLYETKTFSAEEWKPILVRMQVQAEIQDVDRENIYAYVTMR